MAKRLPRRLLYSIPPLPPKQACRNIWPHTKSSLSSSSHQKEINPTPQRSLLHPPKQAPSVWQIFFTDWLHMQNSHECDGKKLNVAQAAKEAGRVYNTLSEEKRQLLKHRALVLKEKYESELAAWKRTLTSSDIDRENLFRAAQRKSGKSRRRNIHDPNAPKRPLSAYFFFLQAIRADARMVQDIFGDTTLPTRQSVLAAAKWRSMTQAEKRPYLDQAENAKLEYEAARKLYDQLLEHPVRLASPLRIQKGSPDHSVSTTD